MSYISETTSRDEFLAEKGVRSRQVAKVALNQFDIFTKNRYGVLGDSLILDIKSTKIYEKSYTVLNQFAMWLGEDHPEISVPMGKSSRPMKPRLPRTIYSYLVVIKAYFEEFGGLEINDRRFKKRVKFPKRINAELEPLTHEDIRLICDVASADRKSLYMILKDTGMRVGEAVQLIKSDIDITKTPIEIKIRAETTKTRTPRTVFVTSETSPMLKNRLKYLKNSELVFATNKDPQKAVRNETLMFKYYREKTGMTEKYSHNQRHKKNIHSIRAFTCTQIADVHGEEFAHGYIGHSKYMGMYVRRKDKLPLMFQKCENNLMIYESKLVVDQDERVEKLEEQQKQAKMDMISLLNIMTQLADVKTENTRKEFEIKQLQKILKNS